MPVAQAPAPAPPADLPDAADDQPTKKPAVRAARPVPAVTIAAAPQDLSRLRTLASVVPKRNVRFVKPGSDADFAVVAALDDSVGDRKVKLFTEQVHIVAGADVHTAADLKDKVVSFGPANGQSHATLRKAFDSLGLTVKETPLDYENAFDGLASGDVDAVVVLAPQPSEYLKTLRTPGLHLVAWPDGASLPDGATLGSIAGRFYPNLAGGNDAIRAVAIDAVLNLSAKGAKQPASKDLLASLRQHAASLAKHGFDLVKADADERHARRVASADRR